MLGFKNNNKSYIPIKIFCIKLISFFSIIIILFTLFSMIFVISVGADDSMTMNVDYLKESYDQQKVTDTNYEENIDTNIINSEAIESKTNPEETNSSEQTTISNYNDIIEPSIDYSQIDDGEDLIEVKYQNNSSQIIYELEDNFIPKANKNIIEKNLGNISNGIAVSVDSENDEISIKSIEFETTGYYENVNYSIKKLDEKPVDILKEPINNCTVYVYLDIKLTTNEIYMHEEEFVYIKFQFKVDKLWIENNNIDPESITLFRFNNGWNPLSTLLINEGEFYLYFEAESPGLSVYTVVGSEIVKNSNDLIIDKPDISLYWWLAIISFILIMLTTIVYKLKLVYRDE